MKWKRIVGNWIETKAFILRIEVLLAAAATATAD